MPTPGVITVGAAESARRALGELLRDKYGAMTVTRVFGGMPYFYLSPNVYDQMISETLARAKEIFTAGGGMPSNVSDANWVSHVNNAVRARRLFRSSTTVTPTPTTVTQVTTIPARIGEAPNLEDLIRETFANILPRYGLAQTYPRGYYIPDVRRNEVAGDLYAEGRRLAATEKYRQAYAVVGGLQLSPARIEQELRERNILPDSEYAEVVTATPIVGREADLAAWAQTAPIFETYQQCRAAAEDQVGRVPGRWEHCLTEEDMVDQAVSHALIQRGVRPYPGSLEIPEGTFEQIAAAGLAITQQMAYQRTYTPVVGGQILQLAQ